MTRACVILLTMFLSACTEGIDQPPSVPSSAMPDSSIVAEVEEAVWAFHAADTARDAEAVIALFWPDFEMVADGRRFTHDDAATGAREFMASIDLFSTDWTDLRIMPLGANEAISSFFFRDSIVTKSGTVIQTQGPTTFVWQRRDGEWRVVFADADHYPLDE